MKYHFFNYKAKDRKGRPCAGSIKALDEESAVKELSGRGLSGIEVEEDLDASSRVSDRSLQSAETQGSGRNFRTELLSYAMPAAAALIALAGIPLMIHFVKPSAPEVPPVQVVEQYLELEKKGDFEAQYELLAKPLRDFYESPQAYENLKRRRGSLEGGFGKVSGVEAGKSGPRKASFEVRMFRLTGLTQIEIGLSVEKSRWKIDMIRDPREVDAALEGLTGVEGQARRTRIVALKNETGYSDLEIEAMLREFQKRRK